MTARLVPEQSQPRITHRPHALRLGALARCDALLVMIPADLAPAKWKSLPRGAWLRSEYLRRKCRAGATLSARLDGKRHGLVIVGLRADTASAFETLHLAGRMLKETRALQPGRIALATVGLDGSAARNALEALLAGSLAAAFELPSFKSRQGNGAAPREITIFDPGRNDFAATLASSEGNNLARWLTALPGNELTPASYREMATTLARREGWRVEFFDRAKLARRGAGAFLAVTQGSEDDGSGILHVQYRGTGNGSSPRLGLVGKGICFDTGGTNLKAHRSMLDMHIDMGGSAVALATLLALTRLRVPYRVDCWLALAENRIGPKAYKPQDVVKASNGTSIQVIHTDAEGRMVLADALAFAAREKPALVLDFATLTGACVNALTERYSGVFTNRPEWREVLERAGSASGERVWCFPMDADFDADLESANADIVQCLPDNKGDHIYAARFLSRFVPPAIPWAHVDLAAATRTGGLAHINTEITGFGVRYAVNLLMEQDLLGEARRAS
ncbi:MAG TPA: leucyl aminopeptidase family protein [Steroidobacteraceae bacterium]|nr:leucyl aminopeptidase family protein [Steroidobacteraceae bacterium]